MIVEPWTPDDEARYDGPAIYRCRMGHDECALRKDGGACTMPTLDEWADDDGE